LLLRVKFQQIISDSWKLCSTIVSINAGLCKKYLELNPVCSVLYAR